MSKKVVTLAAVLALWGCDAQAPVDSTLATNPQVAAIVPTASSLHFADMAAKAREDSDAPVVSELLAAVNAELAARGYSIAVHRAEFVTGGDSPDAGGIVFANDRTLRLGSKWVPGDSRRDADGNNITQLVDQTFATANPGVDSEPAIDRSFDTWENLSCNALPIVKRPDVGEWGSALLLLGGVPGDPFIADIVTVGFLPGFVFDLFFGPGASDGILGVTWTFIWLDGPGGDPTDVDNNGRLDTALKEVWYNDKFEWNDEGIVSGDNIDIETVALHENGHALELGHFGKVTINFKIGKLFVSPRAVMNAFILGPLTETLGTDNASYCGNFASWPN